MLRTCRSTKSEMKRQVVKSGGREPTNVSQSWAQPPLNAQCRGLWTGSLVALVGACACGGEPGLPSPGTDLAAAEGSAPSEPTEGRPPMESPPAAALVKAPGITRGPYPEAPYGTTEGAIIDDIELFGWRDPAEAQFDVSNGGPVRLSEFYNPDSPPGEGTEYIMLNAVTVWCGVCRTEYQHLEDQQTYAEFAPRGLEMVGVLFEDNNGDPSTYADLSNWSRSYSVAFPFLNDPGFKTGVYFDKSATPMNMIIDARTMRIVLVMTGYNPLIYDEIDRLLTERGR